MKKVSKGFTLIEIMIVAAIVGILTATILPAIIRGNCVDKGGTMEEVNTGIVRGGETVFEHRCVMPNERIKKPVVNLKTDGIVDVSKVRESEDYVYWILKVDGCPRAESRLKTYMYSGDPLKPEQVNDLNKILAKNCPVQLN